MGNYYSRGESRDTPATSAFLTATGPVDGRRDRKFVNRFDASTASALKKFGWVLGLQVDRRYRDRVHGVSVLPDGAGPDLRYRAFVVRLNTRGPDSKRYRMKMFYNGSRSEDEARAVAAFVAVGMGSRDFSIVREED